MKNIILTIVLLGLLACQTSKTPTIDMVAKVPENWVSEHVSADSIKLNNWVEQFNDPRLLEIVNKALTQNLDLQVAGTRLEMSGAEAKKAGADLFPVVDLSLSGKRSDFGSAGFGQFLTEPQNEFGASLNVSWEVDVWRRIRNGKDATIYEYYAQEYDVQAARQSLTAQTVKAYFSAIEAKQRLALAEAFVENLEETMDVTAAFFNEGLNSMQDLHVVNTDLARAKERRQNAESAYLSAIRSIELLLTDYPSGTLEIGSSFPVMPDPTAAGIPSEVLENRPDIKAAERRVSAAFYRTNQAKAAKLPTISLTGSWGQNSQELSQITDPGSTIWNIAGNLLFPVFNAGKLNAEIDIKTAEQKNAVASYQQIALNTFSEVETALTDERLFRIRQEYLNEAYLSSFSAETIANENFKIGEIDLIDLLRIKGNTISANTDRVIAQRELLGKWVDLQLALGRGLEGLESMSM